MLEADYIFLHTLLESGDPGRLQRACTEMMRYQNEDGSWSIYPGGPGNISLSVKCYFSAKLMGIGADDRASSNAASGFWRTAASWPATPSPRCISVRSASTTTTPSPPSPRRSCSFPTGSTSTSTKSPPGRAPSSSRSRSSTPKSHSRKFPRSTASTSSSWVAAPTPSFACAGIAVQSSRGAISFIVLDGSCTWLKPSTFARCARSLCAGGEVDARAPGDDRRSGRHLPGHAQCHSSRCAASATLKTIPQVIRARDEFEKLGIEQPPPRASRSPHSACSPAVSPVWDTAQAVYALGEAGMPRNDPRMIKAADWLLSKEVRHKGDWAVKVPNGPSPAAGTSSSTTSSIPTPTTPHRSCSPSTRSTIPASATSTRWRARH
jgi:squalene-hopene/tetraprenyl-beta-curcumene cyclase